MLMLVIHDGGHHADNVLRLGEELARRDHVLRLAVLCEDRHQSRVQRAATSSQTAVSTLGTQRQDCDMPAGSAAQAARVSAGPALSALTKFYVQRRTRLKGTSRLWDLLFDIIEFNSVACILRQRRVRKRFETQIQQIRSAFDVLVPDVLLSWADRHPGIEMAALVVAKERRIRVVLPYVSFSGAGGMLWSRRLYGPRRWAPISAYRAMSTAVLPAAMVREGFLFLEPHVMLALRQVGGLSNNPWCIGCGLSDAVCVDTELTLERYREEGVPEEHLKLIGSPEFDLLVEGIRTRPKGRTQLVERYGWPVTRKILVIGLPQFAEQGILGWDEHWVEIRYILGELTRTDFSVLVSLHPRVDPVEYAFLESEFDIRLSSEPLKNILPLADAFVAVNSSTLVWAVLCGIRTFILDWYGLDASEFHKFTSLQAITRRDDLYAAFVAGVSQKTDFAADWEILSRDRVFDGHVMDRYGDLIRSLAERRTQTAPAASIGALA